MTLLWVALCLTLLALRTLQRWLTAAGHTEALSVVVHLRREAPPAVYARQIDVGLMQLEAACTQTAAAARQGLSAEESRLLALVHLHAGGLLVKLGERWEAWAELAAQLPAAPAPPAPLPVHALRLPELGLLACADGAAVWLLAPAGRLYLHLRLLRAGLGRAAYVLRGLRAPLHARGVRRLDAAGADAGTLARVSVGAYIALLRTPVLMTASSPRAPETLPPYIM